jgi:hypothetical protein
MGNRHSQQQTKSLILERISIPGTLEHEAAVAYARQLVPTWHTFSLESQVSSLAYLMTVPVTAARIEEAIQHAEQDIQPGKNGYIRLRDSDMN